MCFVPGLASIFVRSCPDQPILSRSSSRNSSEIQVFDTPDATDWQILQQASRPWPAERASPTGSELRMGTGALRMGLEANDTEEVGV